MQQHVVYITFKKNLGDLFVTKRTLPFYHILLTQSSLNTNVIYTTKLHEIRLIMSTYASSMLHHAKKSSEADTIGGHTCQIGI